MESGVIVLNKTYRLPTLPAMNSKKIKTLGELKASGYQPCSIKDELRRNLIKKLKSGENTFRGIIGYDESVIPDDRSLSCHLRDSIHH